MITTRKIFGLAAISVVTACGLVIDPDKLVEGNGATDTTDAGADTNVGGNDGGGPSSDASADGAVVEVPECVPAKPTGAQGPYAVVAATSGANIVCPAGYLATPFATAKGNVTADPAQCTNAAGCSCGTASGSPNCGLRVRYYDDSACTKETNSPDPVSGFCGELNDKDYGKVEVSVSGVTCPASGSATPTAKPAPTFRTDFVVCEPDPAVQTAQCKGDFVPLPATKDAAACVVVPANQSCLGTNYPNARELSKTGAVNDTRGCACACSGAASSCTGGSASFHTGFVCTGTSTQVNVGTCQQIKDANFIASKVATAPTAGTAACSARANPTGSVTPQTDLKLCCLSPVGGG